MKDIFHHAFDNIHYFIVIIHQLFSEHDDFMIPEKVCEVKRLYLKKEYRGLGYSKKLLGTVEDYAKRKGYRALFLDTRITLEPAVS